MGWASALTIDKFLDFSIARCTLCGVHPEEEMLVERKDGSHTLKYNRVVEVDGRLTTLCLQCKALISVSPDAKSITRLAARLMAKRKWYLDNQWLFKMDGTPR